MKSPTVQSLKHLRKQGYVVQVVERWNQWARIRQDFAGFADLIAFRKSKKTDIVAIQTTSTGNISSRYKKVLACDNAIVWIQAGGKITLHGWSKKGPRGKMKRWTLTERQITIEDF